METTDAMVDSWITLSITGKLMVRKRKLITHTKVLMEAANKAQQRL
jgi:hypothetical protein